ncbi:type I secretion system permease/ATPase [Oceaniovalibus sp. ACAM 378]|uniref:type I secretion system permease/ATPase n=1 Tax=Oceaniovalibus sp. ACAM 378 TaxID=2599923 RepID=UPI00165217E5|nr:ATP-binding cassette domain-containing protein [Oceaniovalibus sp. ACAM 378]
MAKGDLSGSARLAMRQGGMILSSTFVLSFVVNALRLAGPMFMILIYDRVLTSRSQETLVSLFVMVATLMLVLGMLEYTRKRLIARFAAQFQERMEGTILRSASQNDMFATGKAKPATGLDEVDSLRGFIHSGSLLAVFDFIWAPMFIAVVFILHPVLGWICLGGMAIMLLLVTIRMTFMGGREERATAAGGAIAEMKNMVVASRDVVRSQEMNAGFKQRWISRRSTSRDEAIALRDWTGWFDGMSSTMVMLVRYSVLAAGAYLTLQGQLTVGAMVACTFLVTRVLSPVSRFLNEIPNIRKAMDNWARLNRILASRDAVTADVFPDEIGKARARLDLSKVAVRSPITGSSILKTVDLTMAPGTMVEILGNSGKGKTVLAETILGIWKRSAGAVLVDGVNVARMSDEQTAGIFGYAPENATFIAGTLAENISRLDPEITPEKVISATKRACLHGIITALPDGYDTVIDSAASCLSRGQRHQLSMARAIYNDPLVLVVDEPDTMLLDRLPKTIEATFNGILDRGGVIVLMARKPLNLPQARVQMKLANGVLTQIGKISAREAAGRKTISDKVTVLNGNSTGSPHKTGTLQQNAARG